MTGMIVLISIPEEFSPVHFMGTSNASFAGGDGTVGDPYQISNVTQLQNMSTNLTAHYIIANDINASATIDWNGGKGFNPVGNNLNKFNGRLEGQGFNITDLFINRSSEDYVGLLGQINSGAVLCNVSLIGINVSGDIRVGGLVGLNYYGIVLNCSTSGNVSGYWRVGGLVGRNYGEVSNSYTKGNVSGDRFIGGLVGDNEGMVSNCSSSGNVSGYWGVGGLVGLNDCGTVSNCYSLGNVNGENDVGGLVGWNEGTVSSCYSIGNVSGEGDVGGLAGFNDGTVSNCYSSGNMSGYWGVGGLVGNNNHGTVSSCSSTGYVSGDDRVGGLVGYSSYGIVSNCYSAGNVTGDDDIGGLVGRILEGVVSNCYSTGNVTGDDDVGGLVGSNIGMMYSSFWDNRTSGLSASNGGTGKNTSQMKTRSTFTSAGWDFSTFWGIIDGESYPYLKSFDYGIPVIITRNVNSANEDTRYYVDYNATSLLPGYLEAIWSFNTNASDWLTIQENGVLAGTPFNDEVGTYWVNVSASLDGDGFDFSNFTLTVYNINDIPIITSISLPDAIEDEFYANIFEGLDIDPSMDILKWSMDTDVSFLNINPTTGNLTGLPTNDNVGTCWVNVSVSDGNGGTTWKNLTLTVLNVNDEPVLNITELTLTMKEDSVGISFDLNDVFLDIDGDPLSFDYEGADHLTILIKEGTAIIISDENWFGKEIIHFTASDGDLYVGINVTVIVTPVNDAPLGALIIAESSYVEGRDQIVNATAFDVDIPYGDKLTFRWRSDITGEIGIGQAINLSLPEGIHLITVIVTDIAGLSTTAKMEIEIIAVDTGDISKGKAGNDDHILLLLIILLILVFIIFVITLYVMIRNKKDYGRYEE